MSAPAEIPPAGNFVDGFPDIKDAIPSIIREGVRFETSG
jgi:hypothetical protein